MHTQTFLPFDFSPFLSNHLFFFDLLFDVDPLCSNVKNTCYYHTFDMSTINLTNTKQTAEGDSKTDWGQEKLCVGDIKCILYDATTS